MPHHDCGHGHSDDARTHATIETVGHVAVNILTNYSNNLGQVDNEWPVVTPHEQAAA
ncbi:hypothetical protein [Phytoactinopolyspora mesophila]|uniref:Uncharacterized protein n=1 Tax=Phytoactinopolyspora mesophila TaxID=2650750 RepID=A0A7K3M6A6_9ACTN|nr:hypothetical protein [Phytoactinopolyspora mesophila]NDL58760.1 hypothetical protein [Phytoactinopolyspora mesophila]